MGFSHFPYNSAGDSNDSINWAGDLGSGGGGSWVKTLRCSTDTPSLMLGVDGDHSVQEIKLGAPACKAGAPVV